MIPGYGDGIVLDLFYSLFFFSPHFYPGPLSTSGMFPQQLHHIPWCGGTTAVQLILLTNVSDASHLSVLHTRLQRLSPVLRAAPPELLAGVFLTMMPQSRHG